MIAATMTSEKRKMITNIHKEITYAHPRAKVWRALTEPALMSQWLMKPEGFAPVVGTKFILRAEGPQRGWRGFVECEVLAVEVERTLTYSWIGDPDQPPLTLTFMLEDDGAGTKLVLDHEGFEGIGGWLLARLVMGPGWGRMLKTRIDAVRYQAMKAAILEVVPGDGDGVTFASLPKLVAKKLPKDAFRGASIMWYATTVKLDLEARGLITRVAGTTPQRLVRV
jgi:uncharacterized protein YndB with AHSA1/START domain